MATGGSGRTGAIGQAPPAEALQARGASQSQEPKPESRKPPKGAGLRPKEVKKAGPMPEVELVAK